LQQFATTAHSAVANALRLALRIDAPSSAAGSFTRSAMFAKNAIAQ
jgi:hypothetical protein